MPIDEIKITIEVAQNVPYSTIVMVYNNSNKNNDLTTTTFWTRLNKIMINTLLIISYYY